MEATTKVNKIKQKKIQKQIQKEEEEERNLMSPIHVEVIPNSLVLLYFVTHPNDGHLVLTFVLLIQ